MQPLVELILLGNLVAIRDLVVLVVILDQVLEDGARLPESDTCIWVFNGRDTAIGVDVDIRLLLDN